jgi:hypothetical protein
MVEALHQRSNTTLCQRPHHAGKGHKGMRSSPVFRARRHFTGDYGGTERPLGAIVRRLDPRLGQKTEQAPTVMVPAEFIEQPLIVWIFQATVAQLVGERSLQRFGFGLEACDVAVLVLMPQRQRLLQQGLELLPKSRARPVFSSSTR